MSKGELGRVAAAVQARVPYLSCATEAPATDGWIGCAELVADPALVRHEIEATMPGRRTDDIQVAASLYVQSYAYRVASLAVAAYALDLPSPSCEPDDLAVLEALAEGTDLCEALGMPPGRANQRIARERADAAIERARRALELP